MTYMTTMSFFFNVAAWEHHLKMSFFQGIVASIPNPIFQLVLFAITVSGYGFMLHLFFDYALNCIMYNIYLMLNYWLLTLHTDNEKHFPTGMLISAFPKSVDQFSSVFKEAQLMWEIRSSQNERFLMNWQWGRFLIEIANCTNLVFQWILASQNSL